MFSGLFSLGISFITVGVKRCFSVLWDNEQTNSSVSLDTIHLGQSHGSTILPQKSRGQPALGIR